MALEGNLREVDLDGIFQLIANQRNTGVLVMKSPKGEEVKISFDQGQVVWADTTPRRVEDRLGYVLLKSGTVSQEKLTQALGLQKQTGLRLGSVLVQNRFVEPAMLRAALRTQVLQIIYRIFKWGREGEFSFRQEEEIDIDRENFQAIRVDHILMEGMRMLDEWPSIEKKIPNFKKIFVPSPDAEDMLGAPAPPAGGGLDFSDLGEGGEGSLSQAERLIFNRLDGTHTVQDVMDRVPLTEFEVCRAIVDMMDRGLVEEKMDALAPGAALAQEQRRRGEEVSSWLTRMVAAVGAVAIAASLATAHLNPLNTFYFSARYASVFHEARYGVSRTRIEKIDEALKTFYMSYQRFPSELNSLFGLGMLGPQDLRDPWGRPYEYILTEEAYLVMGHDAEGKSDASLRAYYEFGAPVPVSEEDLSERAEEEAAASGEPQAEPQVLTVGD
jgi:hypothetical protein